MALPMDTCGDTLPPGTNARVAATMPSQAHAGAAQEAPDIGQWERQDVPLVRPSSCNVKGGIPSSRRYLPTYLVVARMLGNTEGTFARILRDLGFASKRPVAPNIRAPLDSCERFAEVP